MKARKVCPSIESYGSVAQRRIAVAKDALQWLGLGALLPRPGLYLLPDRAPIEVEGPKQLRDVVLGPSGVCALGALFIAHVVRFDDCTVKEYLDCYSPWNTRALFERKMRRTFDVATLRRIECAFEQTIMLHVGSSECRQAVQWSRRFQDSLPRLRAILQYIIDHKGNFDPIP